MGAVEAQRSHGVDKTNIMCYNETENGISRPRRIGVLRYGHDDKHCDVFNYLWVENHKISNACSDVVEHIISPPLSDVGGLCRSMLSQHII